MSRYRVYVIDIYDGAICSRCWGTTETPQAFFETRNPAEYKKFPVSFKPYSHVYLSWGNLHSGHGWAFSSGEEQDIYREHRKILDAAIREISAWELSASEIRALAESGSIDAQHIIRAAADGDVVAVQYVEEATK